MKPKKISLIIPCYNEKDNILAMYQRLNGVFLKNLSYELEFIYVDNGSTDGSELIYHELAKNDNRMQAIIMSRNFGSPQPSYLAGLRHSAGDAAILIAGDMEDPPEVIPKFLEKWQEGYEVVYGVRKGMRQAAFRNFLSTIFYWLFQKMAYINIPLDAGDFSLLDRKVINEVVKFDERDFFLRGVRAFVGFKQVGVDFLRDKRQAGESNTSLRVALWWAKTIIINFSFKPLEWVSKLAFFVMIMAFLGIIINLVLYFIIPGAPRGIPTIVILILFLGGIQLLGIGIIGEYLAKIFIEIKHRPRYIIKEIIGK